MNYSLLKKHLGNVPGWRTKRKLVIFLVDDYGSIRMSSKEAFSALVKAGIGLENCRYNRFETIESNTDLELLFEVLAKFKDRNGNHPVFSAICCVANPDFEKIMAGGYQAYHYEPFTETLKRYPGHDRVFDLWKQGIETGIFIPQFHGREHLNVTRWMHDLQAGVKTTRLAFEYGITGIRPRQAKDIRKEYQAAFDIDKQEDLNGLKRVIKEGLQLFENLLGYKATFFTPANGLFNHELDKELEAYGVKLINVGKIDREPLGNGRYRRALHYMGQKNRFNQRYIVRTAQFEPNDNRGIDWVSKCLSDIDIAFKWKKPAIISSHRVNFSGHLAPKNRENGLRQLEGLLTAMVKKWPDAEFTKIDELAYLMTNKS